MPDSRKHEYPRNQTEPESTVRDQHDSSEDPDASTDGKKPPRRNSRNLIPIIMSLALFCGLSLSQLRAQMEVDVTLGATYSDNVFQLSEYDLDRFDDSVPALDYADTSDDLNLAATVNLAYPFRYRWWKFTPSIQATMSQNVSNTDKYRRDALVRFRADRYYWNCTLLYAYHPRIYVRSYVDSDGSGTLEPYSYERNLYRADLNLKPLKNATVQLHGRYEQHFYNQYWTEYDGDLTQLGIGLRYAFPIFSVNGNYYFRTFDNTRHANRDASYESNIYSGNLRLKSMPLSDSKPHGVTWYPALTLSYEERFFQSLDDWYGGRADKIYTTDASLSFDLNPRWNLFLDYSHTFKNVDSPVAAVRRAREYGENRISAQVKYSF